MNTKLIAAVLVALLALGGIYYGLDLNEIWNTQQNLDDAADSANLQTCRDIRESTCVTSSNITEEDYPDSCFQNGEHILETPYQCP